MRGYAVRKDTWSKAWTRNVKEKQWTPGAYRSDNLQKYSYRRKKNQKN